MWHLGVCAYILNGNARTNFCLRKLKMLNFRICSLAIKTERSRWCSRTWTDLKNPKAWFACKHDLENRCFERLEFELNFDLKSRDWCINFHIGNEFIWILLLENLHKHFELRKYLACRTFNVTKCRHIQFLTTWHTICAI